MLRRPLERWITTRQRSSLLRVLITTTINNKTTDMFSTDLLPFSSSRLPSSSPSVPYGGGEVNGGGDGLNYGGLNDGGGVNDSGRLNDGGLIGGGGRNGSGEFYDGLWKEGVMHGKGRYVDACGGEHKGVWVEGMCPEVDFTHVPESGNFRYHFTVRRDFVAGLMDGARGATRGRV